MNSSRPFTIFRVEETTKNLIFRFVEDFFSNKVGGNFNIPDLSAYTWSSNPDDRRLNISSIFQSEFRSDSDGILDIQFPMVLVSFPEFSQADVGIGQMLNKSDSTFISESHGDSFDFVDPFTGVRSELSYRTPERRLWKIKRFHYSFTVNIDIFADTPQSRGEIVNLVRSMIDQYLAHLSPLFEFSVPFTLLSYKFEEDNELVSLENQFFTHFYPAFFPYEQIGVFFDNPMLKGTGDFDASDILGEERIFFSSSFSLENMRAECFKFFEFDFPVKDTRMCKEPEVIIPWLPKEDHKHKHKHHNR